MNHLQRLHDAHSAGADSTTMKPDWAYNRPGIFWWAFNHESAKELGKNQQQQEAVFKGTQRVQDGGTNHMVLLIDEIDKAEPDLPNDLLDTSEFLDALYACIDLEITPDKKPEIWAQVENSILRKKS